MIDFHPQILYALTSVLPVHYEMTLKEGIEVPCISYMELNNYVTKDKGDEREYSRITYQIKIWGNSISTLQDYAVQVDEVMRELGFTRLASGELYDNESSMIQKILTYECLALENNLT